MTFGRWKDNASKRFFYRQNKVTSLCSHPPSFFREEMSRTHPAHPITVPRRRVSSSLAHPHRPFVLSELCSALFTPCVFLHRRQNRSLARSLQGAADRLAHQTMSQQIFFLSEAASFISLLSMWNDSSNVRSPPWKAVEFTFCLSLISFHKPPQTS